MRRVIDYAKEKGLQRVYGDVLTKNTTMLQMCAELGFYAKDIGSGIRRVVLDLENIGSQSVDLFWHPTHAPFDDAYQRCHLKLRRPRRVGNDPILVLRRGARRRRHKPVATPTLR